MYLYVLTHGNFGFFIAVVYVHICLVMLGLRGLCIRYPWQCDSSPTKNRNE